MMLPCATPEMMGNLAEQTDASYSWGWLSSICWTDEQIYRYMTGAYVYKSLSSGLPSIFKHRNQSVHLPESPHEIS